MPSGPHKFGCGEIATGFKSGGFPPGWFKHNKIVPRPPGGGKRRPPPPPGPDEQWECFSVITPCPPPLEGWISEPKCRKSVGGCAVDGEKCFKNKSACEAQIATYGSESPCPRYFDCPGYVTTPGGDGGQSGTPGGPTTPTPGGPTTPTLGDRQACRCVNTAGPTPSSPRKGSDGCTLTTFFFTYECEPASPGPNPPDPVDAFAAAARLILGNTVSVQRGTTASPCKGSTGCDGECPGTYVTIISCPTEKQEYPIFPPESPPPPPPPPPNIDPIASEPSPSKLKSFIKWGCLEAKGPVCVETNENERATECVKCNCKDVETNIGIKTECIPEKDSITFGDINATTVKANLVSAKFDTREECEADRQSPYGGCKSILCVGSNTPIRGISNTAARYFQNVSPANLEIRKTKKLNTDHLATTGIKGSGQLGPVYDSDFNFFMYGFSDQYDLEPVVNHKYLKIFGKTISPVVEYFLECEKRPEQEWDEIYVNELLLNENHIIQSLNSDLNLVFNNLTYSTGKKVDPYDLYTGLTELLITGKLSEFDPNYYLSVYNNQRETEITEYTISEDDSTNDSVALGILAESIIPADPTKHTDENRHFDFVANTKLFLEDINANIPIILEDGTTVPLESTNDGVVIVSNNGTEEVSSILSPGIGYGNYFAMSSTDMGGTHALMMQTELSNAYLTPIDALERAANLIGKDTNMKISVSSVSASNFPHEFESSFSIPTTTDATYFALETSNITSKTSADNHMINELKCSYKVMASSSVSAHSIEAGTQVTEVFLHYNDPIRTYLSDSGYCELDLINIDFHAFEEKKAPLNGEIIVRGNIPKALVFIPAMGSRYNPFHAKSKIENIFNDNGGAQIVTRSCEFAPYLEEVSPRNIQHVSTRKYTYPTYGTYGRGILGVRKENHPLGDFDVDATFFEYELSGKVGYETLFYADGVYTSSAPDVVTPPTAKVVTEVIGSLKEKYKYTHFTWWDIFRRLKIAEYASLQFEMNDTVLQALENGVVTGGTKISMMLDGDDQSNTGLVHPDDNTQYLTETQRLSLLYDGTIAEDPTYLTEEGRRGV